MSDKLLKFAAILACTFVGFDLAHKLATAERGYQAIGGEIFVLALPLLIYAIVRTAKDMKDANK